MPIFPRVFSIFAKRPRLIKIKVVIAGTPKSGTTALFYMVKRSMPALPKTYFEPKTYDPLAEPKSSSLLVKYIFARGPTDPLNLDDAFNHFDKKIFISRDLRDSSISGLLYAAAYHLLFDKSEPEISDFLELLERKEANPQGTAWTSIWARAFGYKYKSPLEALVKDVNYRSRRSIELCRNHQDYFIIKYEDFIDRKLRKLENYLGFPLVRNFTVDSVHQRVSRTMNYGDWRHWFTAEDVQVFKPLVSEYLEYFQYDKNDWRLAASPRILPEHCSLYVKRVLNERRSEVNGSGD